MRHLYSVKCVQIFKGNVLHLFYIKGWLSYTLSCLILFQLSTFNVFLDWLTPAWMFAQLSFKSFVFTNRASTACQLDAIM